MEIEPKNLNDHQALGLVLLFIILIGGMIRFYINQENDAKDKILECPIITIAYPDKFVPRSKIYYSFYLNGKKSNSSYTMPFPNMGKFKRDNNLIYERFWVQVNCKDNSINRIYWEAKVPDTLKFIPANGWDKIPYGLDKSK